MEAAEAGVLRVRVARQGSSSIGVGFGMAGKSPAAAEGASVRAQQCTPAAACGDARPRQDSAAADAGIAAGPRQKRAAAAAASKAWGGAKGQSRSSGSSKAKAEVRLQLVPKPADPSQLVPAPSKAEAATANSGGSYEVQCILAHRVSSSMETPCHCSQAADRSAAHSAARATCQVDSSAQPCSTRASRTLPAL
ncbi:hypothetical protein COO60DRAFT_510337 [Scenedesmus sp. NREL 46B-D3]|nr:hypothetical protein COO60DRAFT_510337 [Scenedesmus sp. NREL 46B-D3]